MAVLCIALSRLRSRLRAISLATMGELEVRARQRLQRFNEQMELQISEVARFQGEFDKYDITWAWSGTSPNWPHWKNISSLADRAPRGLTQSRTTWMR